MHSISLLYYLSLSFSLFAMLTTNLYRKLIRNNLDPDGYDLGEMVMVTQSHLELENKYRNHTDANLSFDRIVSFPPVVKNILITNFKSARRTLMLISKFFGEGIECVTLMLDYSTDITSRTVTVKKFDFNLMPKLKFLVAPDVIFSGEIVKCLYQRFTSKHQLRLLDCGCDYIDMFRDHQDYNDDCRVCIGSRNVHFLQSRFTYFCPALPSLSVLASKTFCETNQPKPDADLIPERCLEFLQLF